MVHSDMLCFVQAFTSSKKKDKNDSTVDNNDTEVSSSKSAKKSFSRKLSFSLKKKSPTSATTSQYDDKTESSPDLSPESYCHFPENMNDQEVSLQQHAAAAAAAEEILTNTPGSSKARQKKFHRNFKEVPPEEKVIDYYSCALVGEVLIHGYLYITKNYFAFYSNLFGNENKFLVPTTAVLSITKDKTPGIKANTVTVVTLKEKHVFGLFLSRDSTYKLMIQVWNAAMKPLPSQYLLPPSKEFLREISKLPINDNQSMNGDESSLSGSDININGSSEMIQHSLKKYVKPIENTDVSTVSTSKMSSKVDECCQTTIPSWSQYINCTSKTNIVMGTSTVLLAILFLSAGILLYRISCLQQNYSQDKDYFSTTRSMSEVQEFLNSNLHHISKVRKSLEALSSLIEKHSSDVPQNNQDFDATASLTENIPS